MAQAEFNPQKKSASILRPLVLAIGVAALLTLGIKTGWDEFTAWMKYN